MDTYEHLQEEEEEDSQEESDSPSESPLPEPATITPEQQVLRFHPMPTILGHTPLFLTRTLDVILTSL